MNEIKEKALSIKRKFDLYRRNDRDSDRNKELIVDNLWGASYLMAAILENTFLPKYFMITRENLDAIYKKFHHETGIDCNIEDLFSKSWIRLIDDKVHIAGVIQHTLHTFEKVTGLENEFDFLSNIKATFKNNQLTDSEFNKMANEYSKRSKKPLDTDRAGKVHWFTIEDGRVKIHELEYYRPVFSHLNDFCFLKTVYDLIKDQDEKRLIIPVTKLDQILQNHRAAFPSTPSMDWFLENKIFIDNLENYALDLRESNISFSGLVLNKTGALLWNKLIGNPAFNDDRERLRFWYDRVIVHHRWCDIGQSFDIQAKERFLDAAEEILINENDLATGEDEYMKVLLDNSHRSDNLAYALSPIRNKHEFPVSKNLFILYRGMEELDNILQGQLMYPQASRTELNYFIEQIVRNDRGDSYKRIFKLLTSGAEKPYLLWKTSFVIYNCEPGLIPYLFINRLTASLGSLILLDSTNGNGTLQNRNEFFKKITRECFQLLGQFLASAPDIEDDEKAKIIFEAMAPFIQKKFEIRGAGEVRKLKEESSEIVRLIQSEIEDIQLPGMYYSGNASYRELLYPKLLNELLLQINKGLPDGPRISTAVTLPFVQLDMLIWVLKLVNKSGDTGIQKTLGYESCSAFLQSYLAAINTEYRIEKDHESGKKKEVIPIWSNEQLNIELPDWGYIFVELEEQQIFDDFLSPVNLAFKVAKDNTDKYNRFVANKLRTHLGILLLGYEQVYEKRNTLKAKSIPVETILDKIETKITSIVSKYSSDDPARARMDIFEHFLERTFWTYGREELLPVIGSTINRFKKENREKIIRELVKTDQLVRTFKLLDYMSSENDKDFLLNLISANDITEFFSKSYSDDAEFVLQKLVGEKSFTEKAREALKNWEQIGTRGKYGQKDKHAILCFRMKLLLAYHDADEQEVKAIEFPQLSAGGNNNFSPHEEKDFYRALIYFKKDKPEKAYNIFNNQFNSSAEDRPVLALNRFAAKLQWADGVQNVNQKSKMYQEALEEWDAFEKTLSGDVNIDFITDKIINNKLHVYGGLKDYDNFDNVYSQIDRPLQLRTDFLKIRLTNLMERNMKFHAEVLLKEAEDYHMLENGQIPESIASLRSLTDNAETDNFLRNMFNRIFSKPPAQLIKILPGFQDKFSDLEEYLLSEIVASAIDMLTNIKSIEEISLEDKFSDLVVLALSNRLKNCGWHVGPARGGASDTPDSKNPGLIDYAIFANKERIAIIEALQLQGKNLHEVEKHNFKIFNYDPARNLFFIVTYFRGAEFKKSWDHYKKDILNEVKFPKGSEMQSNSLIELSSRYGNDSILTAKTIHGIETPIYHVFININYLKPLVKKKKTNTKKSVVKK